MKLEVWQVDKLGPVRLGSETSKSPGIEQLHQTVGDFWQLWGRNWAFPMRVYCWPQLVLQLAGILTLVEHSGGSARWLWTRLGTTLLGLSSRLLHSQSRNHWATHWRFLGLCIPDYKCRQGELLLHLNELDGCHLLIQHVYYVTAVATACSQHHCCYPHYQNTEEDRCPCC